MFDIGFSELLVIGLVALVVIGPERLPRVARTLGILAGRLQRYVADVKADINREVELDELRKMKDSVQQTVSGIENSAWRGLAYVSIFSMLVGFIFWYRGLALGGIAGVGQLQLLQPFFGLMLAGLLLHEPVAWTMIAVTGIVVVCGTAVKRFAWRLVAEVSRCIPCSSASGSLFCSGQDVVRHAGDPQ